MYQDVIDQIDQIVSEMEKNEPVDYGALPIESIIRTTENAAKMTGDDPQNILKSYLMLLDLVTRNNSGEGFAAWLRLIGSYLMYAETMIAFAKTAKTVATLERKGQDYTKRVLECNYYINMARNMEYYQTHKQPQLKRFTGKGVVYTVIVGDYDDVLEPLVKNEEWDYILFTDNRNIRSDIWNVIYIDNSSKLDMARFSRKCKILPYDYLDDYDYSIYLDGSLQIIGDLQEYIMDYSKNAPMLCMAHPENTDIYEEAKLCLEMGKGDREQLLRQIEEYKRQGFPDHYGLTANGVLVRDHKDDKLRILMKRWWDEIMNGSSRDQISFTFCCWKDNFIFDVAPINIYNNRFIKYCFHKQ